MGTNYYWRHNICDCCHRYDEMHICKSLRSFRGYFGEREWSDEHRRMLPAPPLVVSWRQWRDKLRSAGEVWDEYGTRQDTEEFIARVEAVPLADRRRQHDWVVEHYPPGVLGHRPVGVQPDGEWLDADGFSFYGGAFS